ncbi:hypothetical protein DQ04_00021030 [Trypanosoma grayi]|uniref:hypothetical protein n=1 Tax=Trypanosoma grayi TaxID=71804 RepID=UPI0004F3EFAF|nr:hypothetical protein DQ04_00021030 [Trypanosoma grayi]KEG15605.1 hypothetical protein DQ04_00021030 [Trypanosoma grayi]
MDKMTPLEESTGSWCSSQSNSYEFPSNRQSLRWSQRMLTAGSTAREDTAPYDSSIAERPQEAGNREDPCTADHTGNESPMRSRRLSLISANTSHEGSVVPARCSQDNDYAAYDSGTAAQTLRSDTFTPLEWSAAREQGCRRRSHQVLREAETEVEPLEDDDEAEKEEDGEGDNATPSKQSDRTSIPNDEDGDAPEDLMVSVAVHDASEGQSDVAQVHISENATDPGSATIERMRYDAPEDPRNYIINVIVNSAVGSVTLQSIHDALHWDEQFKETNGSVLDYLQGYQSIFAVSPVDDRVTLRRPLQTAKGRRVMRGNRGCHVISSRIGSMSCSCVATSFDLDLLSSIYKRRGYNIAMVYGVLHVSSHHTFDLFLFRNGVVVWWGMNRCDHWLVEDDFLSSEHSYVSEAVKGRHPQDIIDDLFPFWCSYELDERYNLSTPTCRDEALQRFATHLCFDHYLIPDVTPLRWQVMLTVSHSLSRTAVVDLYDNVTQSLHKQVLAIPSEIKGLLDYFSTRRQIAHLEGALHLALMATTALRDTPEFLWEMAWLYDYHELAERQNSSEQLLSWFSAKSDALLQQLDNIKVRRYCLFMLGSDVFLILLLIADVCFMLGSFVVRLYFPMEGEEGV